VTEVKLGLDSYSCHLEGITEGATEAGKGTNGTGTGIEIETGTEIATKTGMEVLGVAEPQTVMRRDARVGLAVHVGGTEIRRGTGEVFISFFCLMK